MDEKILAQYRVADDPNFKKVMWMPYIVLVLGIAYALFGVAVDHELAPIMVGFGGFIVLLGIILLVVFGYIAKTSLTVTTSRVYGHAKWEDIDLPMDSISSIAKTTRKKGASTLIFSTSSGKIPFGIYTLEKLEELHQVVSQQIANRQNSKDSVTVVNNTSNADELKKYKDLLDAGILTQEEFDAKKKQLLGL